MTGLFCGGDRCNGGPTYICTMMHAHRVQLNSCLDSLTADAGRLTSPCCSLWTDAVTHANADLRQCITTNVRKAHGRDRRNLCKPSGTQNKEFRALLPMRPKPITIMWIRCTAIYVTPGARCGSCLMCLQVNTRPPPSACPRTCSGCAAANWRTRWMRSAQAPCWLTPASMQSSP